MNFKLFKLYAKIYYNFLLGKINNSIPKLNINSLLEDIGLGSSITSQRTNGFLNALETIKKQIHSYE